MAGYKFGDSDNKEFSRLKEGDYILEVVGFGFGVSNQEGAPAQVDLKVSVVNPKDLSAPPHELRIRERLTLSEKAAWRVDTFLKSCGITLAKGVDVEFDSKLRNRPGCTFVDLRGLRGWGSIVDQPSRTDPKKIYSAVGTWYTNRDKVPRREYPPLDGSQPSEMSAAEAGAIVPF
jgi:hypothetical protein